MSLFFSPDWFFDEDSEKGNLLLDFLAHRFQLRRYATRHVVEACVDVVRNKMEELEGECGLVINNSVFILCKDNLSI